MSPFVSHSPRLHADASRIAQSRGRLSAAAGLFFGYWYRHARA